MKLDLSDDEVLLQDAFARLFREEATPERVRAAEATGWDRDLWAKLVALGVVGMRAPEALGGGGWSLMDAAIVAAEAGRALAPAPVVEGIVGSSLLIALNAPAALRQPIEAGGVAVLALHPTGSGPQVIPAGATADLILALDGETVVAFGHSAEAPRARNTAGAPLALLDLGGGEAGQRTTVASGPDAARAFRAAIEEYRLLNAAALAALSRRALEMAAVYAGERVQYGKPIGSFQGVAHPLADSATEVDGAQLLVWRAIWAIAEGRPDAGAAVAMAHWWASQAADKATARALRAFGGYGLSLEYDIQLYFRRAKVMGRLADSPGEGLDLVADRLWVGAKADLPDAGAVGVDFGFGAAGEAYAAELRAFVEANMTPEVAAKKHHSTAGHHPGFHKALAEAGHAFPDLAAAGGSRSRYEVMAAAPMWEDMGWTRTPIGVTEFVAKMVELWGTEEAKAEILPRIVGGDALGCLGFSEPESGSDVFSARFSAVRDGDDWVMNGQKMFTTNAHNADYILMLTRTDSSGKKHQGLTMFAMPLKVPGVDIQPVHTLQDERTNIVYFGDVRIADRYRLGEVGDGARVMGSALQFEHGGAAYHAAQTAMLKHAVAWSRKPARDGRAPILHRETRRLLARAAVHDEVAEVLCRRQIWAEAEGVANHSYGPMAKVFATETLYADASAIMAFAGPAGLIRGKDRDLDVVELAMRRALGMTVYGGTSEVHRSLIAENALGMPKSRS